MTALRRLLATLLLWCVTALPGWAASPPVDSATAGDAALLVPGGEPYSRIRPLLKGLVLGNVGGSVAISPDGQWVATGTNGGVIRLLDLASGRERARLQGHESEVTSVAFSPDGRTLASGSWDKSVRLWDLASGRERARLQGHESGVTSVAFSPDSRTLASGSGDSTVRLWDPASGEEMALLLGGHSGQWLACLRRLARCNRADDGLLLPIATAGQTELMPFKPEGSAQMLQVAPTVAMASPISVTTTEPFELRYPVRNTGNGPAYWLELAADDAQPHPRFAAEPGRWRRLDAGQTATLTLRVHLHPDQLNPQAFDVVVQPLLRQAYGPPTRLPPVTLHAVPPMLVVESASLLGKDDQRTLIAGLKNIGSALWSVPPAAAPNKATPPKLVFTARLGATALTDELSLTDFAASAQRTVSFGLEKAISTSGKLLMGLTAETRDGWPIHDWRFDDVPVSTPGLPLAVWLGAAVLMLTLAAWLYFQRVYRHPLVLALSHDPTELLRLDPGQLAQAGLRLRRTGRLATVLDQTLVDSQWLAQAAAFDTAGDGRPALHHLAQRLMAQLSESASGPVLNLGENFTLNLSRLPVQLPAPDAVPRDVIYQWATTPEVTLLLGRTPAQRQALSALTRERPGLLVTPDGAELTGLLLAPDPQEALARLVARYVPVTQISPYQTGAGVHRASMFFGRGDLMAQVMGRAPANYLVVGGRQVGKSSLLKALARRFADDPAVDVHYVALASPDVAGPLAAALGIDLQSDIEAVLRAAIRRPGRRTVFVIDEVDLFVEREHSAGYPTLQRFRALSEGGHAQFILAGFWSLYLHTTLDYQSPLRNFGAVLTVAALERDACVALATEPMSRVGISWADAALVSTLLDRTGQRANLISIACDELIKTIGTRERTITSDHLNQVLDGKQLRDQLGAWSGLGTTARDKQIDRIVVYASVEREPFTLAEVMDVLEAAGMAVEPEAVKQSVMRLDLAFVLARNGERYHFQVPLQRDLILAMDPQATLRRELRGFAAGTG